MLVNEYEKEACGGSVMQTDNTIISKATNVHNTKQSDTSNPKTLLLILIGQYPKRTKIRP